MELVREVSEQEVEIGLQSWTWLDFTDRTPYLGSLFGDLFFASAGGAVWMLDVLEGTFSSKWASADEMIAVLGTEDGQDQHLLGGIALGAFDRGMELASSEIFVFTPPPILGGPVEVDNLTTMDAAMGINMLGQIHDHARKMLPGTVINWDEPS